LGVQPSYAVIILHSRNVYTSSAVLEVWYHCIRNNLMSPAIKSPQYQTGRRSVQW